MEDLRKQTVRYGLEPRSSRLDVYGISINLYTQSNHQTGRVELLRPMPRGVEDVLIKDFANTALLREWVATECASGRLL